VLNYQVDFFSTFWYTSTFMFQHFDLKLPILGQTLTVWGLIGSNVKTEQFNPKDLRDSASFEPLCVKIIQNTTALPVIAIIWLRNSRAWCKYKACAYGNQWIYSVVLVSDVVLYLFLDALDAFCRSSTCRVQSKTW